MNRELKKLKKELLQITAPKHMDILAEIFREENFSNIMLDEDLNDRQLFLKQYLEYHLAKDEKNKNRVLELILKR